MMNLQDGNYRARAIAHEYGVTSKGNDMVAVTYELLDKERMMMTWYGYFTDATIERTYKALRHSGWDGRDLLGLDGLGDTEVELVVVNETYEGKTRPRVNFVNPVGAGRGAVSNPLDQGGQEAFKRRVAGKIAAIQAKLNDRPAAAPAPAAAAPAPAGGIDDLPF